MIFKRLAIILFLLTTLFLPNVSKAGSVFGGKILKTLPCMCPVPGLWIVVGPPKPGAFFLGPTAKLHLNMKPIMGSWVLGDYSPMPGACASICGPHPVWYPYQGTIGKIGTS